MRRLLDFSPSGFYAYVNRPPSKRTVSNDKLLERIRRHHAASDGTYGAGRIREDLQTFIASALGHIACRHGYQVKFARADETLKRLRQSRVRQLARRTDGRPHDRRLLIRDDFAFEPMTKEESNDVYQLFLERTGRASMIVTSNHDAAEWLAMFDDVLLAQSAVDRFRNSAYDFVVDGEAYRPRLEPKIEDADPPAATRAMKPPALQRRRVKRRR